MGRARRGLVAVGMVLTLVLGLVPSTAFADGAVSGACTLYANSTGFGGYCGGGGGYFRFQSPPPSWRQMMHYWQQRTGENGPFIPCKDFPIPAGVDLPPPPDGKTWSMRVHIVDYDLNRYGGGPNVHLEREIVPLSDQEREQCPNRQYMDYFWNKFDTTYPTPVLVIKPTYTPRVNVPAYFSLTRESSWAIEKTLIGYDHSQFIRMTAIVGRMTIDPGDGSRPVDCLMGVDPAGSDGYDETKDPFHQTNPCNHVYKRSSANQPDGMYTVRIGVFWDVKYWRPTVGWTSLGRYQVKAVQRLPVQEVQAVGG